MDAKLLKNFEKMNTKPKNKDLTSNDAKPMLGEVKVTNKVDWSKITKNSRIKALIIEREKIENEIRLLDEMALVNYELEALRF